MFRLDEAAQGIGAEAHGEAEVASVGSDSRKVAPASLFVALPGERFDGHDYVESAFAAGAGAAMVAASQARRFPGRPLLVVDDVRLGLGRLASWWRGRFSLPLVAVTGSNGKTTVKEMAASILRQATGDGGVLATTGNLNNDIGLPLTLLGLGREHRFAVVEMGMNHPGEIDYLSRLARPTVALVNNAQPAHLAGLGTIEAVARAKGEIFNGLGPEGVAIVNADDANAELWRAMNEGRRLIGFSLQAGEVVGELRGARVHVRTPDGVLDYRLQVPGAHNVRNSLAAVAVAVALGVDMRAMVAGLEGFVGVKGRLKSMPGRGGMAVIDDSYNANPGSVAAAIDVLAEHAGRRVLVLGDMGELGEEAAGLHFGLGVRAKEAGLDALFGLGDLASHAVAGFGSGGRHFADVGSLVDALAPEAGATVLVKGSRFMRMERVVSALTEETACC